MDSVSSNIHAFLQTAAAKQNLELATDRDIWKAEAERMTSGYDAAQSELAALREEMTKLEDRAAELSGEVLSLKLERNAAEQRNVELVELLQSIKRHDPDTQCMSYPMHRRIDAAIKPTESGASE